ncbi:MAG: ribosome small subunit-dependent GTPase A [Bradymonadia bacterium]
MSETHGRVVGRLGPVMFIRADEDDAEHPCQGRGPGKAAVVGDRVAYTPGSGVAGDWGVVTAVGERSSVLQRKDPIRDHPLTLAANVDVLVIVCAIEPPLRTGLIDRYLVAAHQAGIQGMVVVNKCDLAGPDHEAHDLVAHYPGLDVPVFSVSAHSREGVEALGAALDGRLSIFVGHSGVGKTSLLNVLCPGLQARVNALSDASGRGQHTTTASALVPLPTGGEIIDTPGVRGFALWGVKGDTLKEHFPEFTERAAACKFADCNHLSEPGCAVRAALDAGEIHPLRYRSYRRILESLDAPFHGMGSVNHEDDL